MPYKVVFIKKPIPKDIYEFNEDLLKKVKNNNNEIIEKNKISDNNSEKSYRRKIKKKIIDN